MQVEQAMAEDEAQTIRWVDLVRGPPTSPEDAAAFTAYTHELTRTYWPLLGALIAACAFVWWPLDQVVFATEPSSVAAFGAFRARIIAVDLTLALALPRARFLVPYAHMCAFLAAVTNLALAGWYIGETGEDSARWLPFAFVTPVFSVLLPVPLLPRIGATLTLAATVCGAWLLHPTSDFGAPGVLASLSYMLFLVGLDVFIGHLLFIQAQRSFHLRRRVAAQRQELLALTDHLEQRVEVQTAQIRELGERARHARAEQRREIARELHDGIGQELTSLRLLVGLRARLAPRGTAPDTFTDLDAQITRLQGSLRRILESMRPEPLADGSLLEALENLCGEMERRSGLPCTFRATHASFLLPANISLGLFRVAQEGLTNAVRHARATRLSVDLVGEGDRLLLRVSDDGVGFDPQRLDAGQGTRNIRERAESLGGTARWTFTPGTQLDVSVPLEGKP